MESFRENEIAGGRGYLPEGPQTCSCGPRRPGRATRGYRRVALVLKLTIMNTFDIVF